MSQTAAKRKRDKLDEDGPEKKKAKVSELPILSALDAKQKAAIFAAYQTQNDTLFEISCGTFSIDVSETKQELIQHTKITLSNTYLNLRFSVKKKFELEHCGADESGDDSDQEYDTDDSDRDDDEDPYDSAY
eukprot:1108439_1